VILATWKKGDNMHKILKKVESRNRKSLFGAKEQNL
jgi:hypothetical protein